MDPKDTLSTIQDALNVAHAIDQSDFNSAEEHKLAVVDAITAVIVAALQSYEAHKGEPFDIAGLPTEDTVEVLDDEPGETPIQRMARKSTTKKPTKK